MKNHEMNIGFYISLSEKLIVDGEYPHPEDFIYDHLGALDDDHFYIEGNHRNKWLFTEPVEGMDSLIDFDSFLELDSLDMNEIIKSFKEHKSVEFILKKFDKVWGNENYTLNLGLYWIKTEY